MYRNQVFVRAQLPQSKKWVSADVLDLDQPSLNALVIDVLFRMGALVGLSEDAMQGNDRVTFLVQPEHEAKYLNDD